MTVGRSASEREEPSPDPELWWISVVVPEGVPVLCPQAARVLCRIVVRLAEVERENGDASAMEERRLERR
jgi:hypothetical protein